MWNRSDGMTAEEIRLRRLAAQNLLFPDKKDGVTRNVCGFQAQFFPNVRQALGLRTGVLPNGDLGDGFAKSWTLRGTIHVFSRQDLPLFLGLEEHYRENRWDTPTWWNQRPDWTLTPARQQYFSSVILEALEEGPKNREELKALCRTAGMTEAEEGSLFHPWGGGLRELCQRGFLHYLPREEKVFALTPEISPMERDAAWLELARRYFTYYGPATIHDAQYFFRVTATQVKGWLSKLPVQHCQLEGRTYYFIESAAWEHASMPECLLLAGFDPLMLGYEKKESLFLAPEHMRKVFNLGGIVFPTILLRGMVVGKWNRRGEAELFEDLPARDRTRIAEAVQKNTEEAFAPSAR